MFSSNAVASPWTEAEVGDKIDDITLSDGFSWNTSDYWRLTDFTSGYSGASEFTLTLEHAAYESAFGLYTVNDYNNPTATGNYFQVFDGADEPDPDDITTVLFKEEGGVWSVKLDDDPVDFWTEFDFRFGFYFEVDNQSNGIGPDFLYHTDKQFNTNYSTGEVGTDIEHVIVAYNPLEIGNGGTALVYLDDQWGGGDRDWNDMRVKVTDVEPVPEPATMLLFGTGVAGLFGVAKRKRMKK